MSSLMSKVTKLILIIFGIQLIIMGVGYVGIDKYLNKIEKNKIIDVVSKIDPYTLEEIAVYNLTGNETASTIILYDLIQKKNLAEAKFIKAEDINSAKANLIKTFNCENNICHSHDAKLVASFVPVAVDGNIKGYVLQKAMQSQAANHHIFEISSVIVALLLIGTLMNIGVLVLFFRNRVHKELIQIIQMIKNDRSVIDTIPEIKEFRIIQKSLKEAQDNRQEKVAIETTLKIEKEKNLISRQVAHDIKSPIAALEMATDLIKENDESIHKIIDSATIRIKEILTGLEKQATNNTNNEFIPTIINSIIEEKKLEYNNTDINFVFPFEHSTQDHYSFVNATEFGRVISNIINNSVEAINIDGTIALNIESDKTHLYLSITDTGSGIPDDVLSKIFDQGFSHNKAEGTGLGLFHAKQTLAKWGADLSVHSQVGIGTEITIKLKRSPIININKSMIDETQGLIVIADDDINIHNVWTEKLKNTCAEVITFTSAEDIDNWLKDNAHKQFTLFIDHDFIGEKMNGLNIIDKYNLTDKSYLVTANALNPVVISKSLNLNVNVLDKSQLSKI